MIETKPELERHELRNHLGVISICASILEKTTNDEEFQEAIHVMRKEISQMTLILNNEPHSNL